MIRSAASGIFRGLARLLSRGGNDAGGFEILNLGAPQFPTSAARLADVGEVFTKYFVGPAWTGAQWQTIGAAIAQAEIDEPEGTVLISVYPGEYFESVVVPSTLPRCTIAGVAAGFIFTTGAVLTGSLTWNMAPGGATGIGISVNGPVVINDPGNVTRAYIRFGDVNLFGPVTVNSVASNLGATIRAQATLFSQTLNGAAHTFRLRGGAWLEGGTFTLHSGGRLTGVDMKGSYTNVAWNLHSNTNSWNVAAGCEVWGRVNFSGASCVFRESYIDYPGPPAITDACTSTSFCQGNSFAHNTGPGTFAYVKTGTSLLHEGGNVFLEGQEYPWYDIQAGSVHQGGAEMDVQLRRVLSVSGTVVLTPAQVGAQRKTTVRKTDGGGSVALPLVGEVEPGCTVLFKDVGNATANPWEVVGSDDELIDGSASYALDTNRQAVEVQSDGSGWMVIGAYL